MFYCLDYKEEQRHKYTSLLILLRTIYYELDYYGFKSCDCSVFCKKKKSIKKEECTTFLL